MKVTNLCDLFARSKREMNPMADEFDRRIDPKFPVEDERYERLFGEALYERIMVERKVSR